MVSDNLSAENSKLSAEFVVQLLQVLELNFVNYVANDCSSRVKEGVSRMKPLFLALLPLLCLILSATTKNAKHFLLEAANKKNTSKSAKYFLLKTANNQNANKKNKKMPIKKTKKLKNASPAENSNRVGSDYASSLCNHPTCPKEVVKIPDEPPTTRKDPICAENSRHGGPCTT